MKTGSFIHYEAPCATIHWEDDDRIVWVEWKATPDSASFRKVLDAGLELIVQKGGQRWLADCLKMGPVSVDDTKWANEDWTPRIIAAGVKWLAFVMPERVSASISVLGFLAEAGGATMDTMECGSIDDAKRWLREQR